MKLTKKFLQQIGLEDYEINFFERNKLLGFPLDRFNEIEGDDYNGFVQDLRVKLECKFQFDDDQNVIKIEDYCRDEFESYEYDQNGNKIKSEDSYGVLWEYEYDSKGNETKSINVTAGYWCKFEYDLNGNEIKTEDSYGDFRLYYYDCNNNKIKTEYSNGNYELYSYDRTGYMIRMEDPNGNWRECEYDSDNRLVREESYVGLWKTYEYNQNGYVIKENDQSNKLCIHDYDQNGNRIMYSDSNGNYWSLESEFYDNGQLKRYGDLKIPYFEQS